MIANICPELTSYTRPDITYAVNRLSSFNANPTNTHWKAAKRVLRYLKGHQKTKNSLIYGKNNDDVLHGYWATLTGAATQTSAEAPPATSSSSMAMPYLGTLSAKRQSPHPRPKLNTCHYSRQVENLYGLSTCCQTWAETPETKKISCDNQSAIELAKKSCSPSARSKHIDIKLSLYP